MNKATIALTLALQLVPALALAEKTASNAQHPDLSGSWSLNQAMSENAHDKMRELRSQRRGGRGGFGGPPAGTGRGGGVGDGWGRGRGGGFGQPGGERRGGLMTTIDQGVDALEIGQSADQLSITYSDDRLRILFVDGRKDERTGPMGDVVTRAKWSKNGELVVKSKTEGGKTTEIYRLDEETGRLLVDVSISGPMGDVTFYRTYDRKEEAAKSGT